MSENNNTKSSGRMSYTGVGMALGLILGGLVGLLVDNMIVFAGGGLVIGLAIGRSIESRKK